ncbi:hypothetical protein ACFS2C_25530 [Prauserella oleivorans]|uniref:Uncharacterized protein n=1 Tax=Prauserella oleivorans TaxID=1478153 RepID=A0ABW5WFZ1_9PSEU
MADKLHSNAKSLLTANLDFNQAQKPIANSVLRGAAKVGSKFPIVGGVITGIGLGLDIAGGKDPATAVTSGVGGFVAGSLATAGIAAAGGPVGWAVAGGALVSAGVGFAIEEWGDDVAGMAGDAADWAGDRPSDAGNAIGKAGKAVGDFLGDLF